MKTKNFLTTMTIMMVLGTGTMFGSTKNVNNDWNKEKGKTEMFMDKKDNGHMNEDKGHGMDMNNGKKGKDYDKKYDCKMPKHNTDTKVITGVTTGVVVGTVLTTIITSLVK